MFGRFWADSTSSLRKGLIDCQYVLDRVNDFAEVRLYSTLKNIFCAKGFYFDKPSEVEKKAPGQVDFVWKFVWQDGLSIEI